MELLDATCGVDETLFTSVGRVRVGSDVADDDLVLNAINDLSLAAAHGRTSKKLVTRRNVDESNWVEFWVDVRFHADLVSLD